jgi:NAD(P)-dependent dehydrogenase (short-subunit alcohol dehydrogenase family)
MNSRFSDQVVLVAGGTGGLGRAVSLAFLQEGAQVAVTYRNQDELVELQKAAGPHGSALKGYPVDVTDEAAVRQLVSDIVGQSGKLDAMVNAVGGYAGGKSLWDVLIGG